jgi:antitoxin component of RelBE/YafQ-DinJ toxin-antitoxin module
MPYKQNTKEKYVSFRVTNNQHQKLKALSDKQELTISDLIRIELREFLQSL